MKSKFILILMMTLMSFGLYQNCGDGFRSNGSVDNSSTNNHEGHVDLVPPELSLSAPGNGLVNTDSVQIDFSVTDEDTSQLEVTCSLDDSTPQNCRSPYALNNLAEGPHSLRIIATDGRGNTTEQTIQWVVDTEAPTLTLLSNPANTTANDSATFTFVSNDTTSMTRETRCQLDGGPWEACTSPITFNNLTEGTHTFNVESEDAASNTSPVESYSWTVILSQPSIALTSVPGSVNNVTSANFQFTALAVNPQIFCSLDGATPTACTSPMQFSGLSEGSHQFEITGQDSLGQTISPVTYNWIIDLTDPSINFTSAPNTPNDTRRNFTLRFVASDNQQVAAVGCALDGGPANDCTAGSMAINNLTPGSHLLNVYVADTAGNIITRSFNWNIFSCDSTSLSLQWPVPGTYGIDQVISNFFDLDPSSNIVDYNGGHGFNAVSYNGHTGTDIAIENFLTMRSGRNVVATEDGIVEDVLDGENDDNIINVSNCSSLSNWSGNYIKIRNQNGFSSWYIHLRRNSIQVAVGDTINKGDVLAQVGSSGCSSGAHLHYELHTCNNVPVDPFTNNLWADEKPYNVNTHFPMFFVNRGQRTNQRDAEDPDPDVNTANSGDTLTFLYKSFGSLDTTSFDIEVIHPNGSVNYSYTHFFSPESRSRWYYTYYTFATRGVWRVRLVINGNIREEKSITIN